jgi:hypothetical protein
MVHVVQEDDVTPVSRGARRKFGEAEDTALHRYAMQRHKGPNVVGRFLRMRLTCAAVEQ